LVRSERTRPVNRTTYRQRLLLLALSRHWYHREQMGWHYRV
jgi:hypothetical protein